MHKNMLTQSSKPAVLLTTLMQGTRRQFCLSLVKTKFNSQGYFIILFIGIISTFNPLSLLLGYLWVLLVIWCGFWQSKPKESKVH
jgi:hypothetical protein